jgi:hypothetical protein
VWRLSLDENPIENIEPLLNLGELELVSLKGVANISCDTLEQLIGELGARAVITEAECPAPSL